MLIIRLSRVGRKNDPSFRIVLQEKHRAPTGKVIEFLGFYNSRLKQKSFKEERIKYWLGEGAQVSDTVHNLLVSAKIIDKPKRKATSTSKKKREKRQKSTELKTEEKIEKKEPAEKEELKEKASENDKKEEPKEKISKDEKKEKSDKSEEKQIPKKNNTPKEKGKKEKKDKTTK